MKLLILYLTIILSACTEPSKQVSVKQIESSADTGGALAIYRHMDKMDRIAKEMNMLHPIEGKK